MKTSIDTFHEHSVIGTCLRLAQTAFFDTLPANAEGKGPTAPAAPEPTKLEPLRPSLLRRMLAALERWVQRQRMSEREAYLAKATDLYDLEVRLRQLDRRPYPYF
jgi:hypothetical protein